MADALGKKQTDFSDIIEQGYYGKILSGDFSAKLKKRTAEIIRLLRRCEKSGGPAITYVSAWRNDENIIWYEFCDKRFIDLLGCSHENVGEVFRNSIVDRRVYKSMKADESIKQEIIHHDQLTSTRIALREEGRKQGEIDAVYKIALKNGNFLWLKDQANIETYEKGNACLSIGVLTIVTKEMKAEEALRESEEKFSKAFQSSPDAIQIIRLLDGDFIDVNDGFLKMTGYSRKEVFSKGRVDQLNWINPQDFETLSGEIKKNKECNNLSAVFHSKNGNHIPTLISGKEIEMDGAPCMITIARDMTERKKASEEKKRLIKENIKLRTTFKDRYRFGDIIGKSPVMQEVYELILKAAVSDANVVIYGESGTGKELVARTIHDMSDRNSNNFVPVNCGAIPETLFESEFFGHKKGAFTGAYMEKKGFFDLAHHGTLFLDEVGELSQNLQAKLLRAIEGGGYTPVGGTKIQKVDVKIIAATNKNLTEMVNKGTFREDFLYRLHIIPIHVPPLKDRKEDIPLLLDHFLNMQGQNREVIPGKVFDALFNHNWPGNVRELENVLKRYVTIKQLDFIKTDKVLSDLPKTEGFGFQIEPPSADMGLRDALNHFEKEFITNTLKQNRWHRKKTAQILGIPERTLYRKLKQFDIIS